MDKLLEFHFAYFDELIQTNFNGLLVPQIENRLNEVKEKLKNTFNEESEYYTLACHYMDKKFDEYIESKSS